VVHHRDRPLLWPKRHLPPSLSNRVRPDWIGWPRAIDTPSAGNFLKEPLGFLEFQTAVLSGFKILIFMIYFNLKLFELFTGLPLVSNASKIHVLTPIRSVQVALGS
jgi:hypothetical protein